MAKIPLKTRRVIDAFQQLLQNALQDTSRADFGDLRLLRAQAPSQLDQELLAQLEHRAFARDYGGGNLMHTLALMAAIPGYQGVKGLGLMGSRTGSSDPFGQMFAGFQGLIEGWR